MRGPSEGPFVTKNCFLPLLPRTGQTGDLQIRREYLDFLSQSTGHHGTSEGSLRTLHPFRPWVILITQVQDSSSGQRVLGTSVASLRVRSVYLSPFLRDSHSVGLDETETRDK